MRGPSVGRVLASVAAVGSAALLAGFSVGPMSVFEPPSVTIPAPPPLQLSAAIDVARAGLPAAELCLGTPPCDDRREVWVDYTALGVPGRVGGEWIAYDYDEFTRPIRRNALAGESEPSIAVRTLVSEVGADRLLTNRYALLEAVGILYTIDNRLDPTIYDPEDRDGPVFPGCGPDGTLGTCANGQQYNGNATWRALSPRRRYAPQLLASAVDVAVTAWWLQEHGYVSDFTHGATNYVHRCGGAAYGETTHHCDAHLGRPQRDVRGADPHTGPTVFRAPASWLPGRGYYALYESVRVEYDPWWAPAGADGALVPVPPRFPPDPAMAADVSLANLAEGLGPPMAPEVLAVLAAIDPR